MKVTDELFLVESDSSKNWYNVDLEEMSCDCADHRYRGVICKHQRRAAVLDARGEVDSV